MMNLFQQKPSESKLLTIIFIIVVIIVLAGGHLFFTHQRRDLQEEKLKELTAICDLKIRQISQWRLERLGGGEFLGENNLMINKFAEFLQNPVEKTSREDLLETLESLVKNYDYRSATFIDTSGRVRLSFPEQDSKIGDHIKSLIPGIIRKKKVELTDLHRAENISYVHLDLLVPLVIYRIKGPIVIGVLALRIDPEKILFPLIQMWPTESKSSESLLIRKDGDSLVYLNKLRHIENSELILKLSVTTDKLAAVMAVHGITSTTDAIDYRGVPVIAAMKKVPGTQWYMVTKADKKEVFETFYSKMILVVLILALIISSTALLLSFIFRNQRVKHYREKYETELDRLALVKHFDYILKYANDIIVLYNSDLSVVEANDCALMTYMYSREEFIGLNLKNIRTPESWKHFQEDLKKIDENGSATYESIHRRKDGSSFPLELSTRIVNIEGSKYYQTIGRNITDRKRSEETLRESEEKFRKIFEESPLCMAMTDKDMSIIRANLSFCKMIGYSEEELKFSTFKDFTHHDHIAKDEISLLKLVAKEIPIYQTEKRYIKKDGSLIWASTTVNIVRNNRGEVQFFIAMVEDITSRKKAESELESSFSLVKATLESTADGLLVVDTNGKIVQFNQKFIQMWKIPMAVLDTGEDEAALNYVKNQLASPDSFLENVKHLYAEPEASTSDILEFIDGRCFERYSQPQKINGKSVGRVWSFRDITEKKGAERDLIAAKEKAEEGDRLKTAFLHNVSHEIRTPMNAILGFSTLLNEPDVTDIERHQYGEIILQSSNQLLSIINDIVDIANVEAGQVKMNFSKINLNIVLRNLNEQFSYQGKELNIAINLRTGLSDEESEIRTDSTKLIQVISNLLNNSLKFTIKGTIDFGYKRREDFLEFEVSDTGIGIPPEHIDKIFNRFYQVDAATARQFGGTGLGLSICKAYIELLGGNISVESTLNKGTRFSFTIPYIPVAT